MDFILTAFISILDGLLGSGEKKKEDSKIALYSAILHNKNKKVKI